MVAHPAYPPHARVRISGLSGRADLNGRLGVAGSLDLDAGRYAVCLDDGECVKVRPANLQLAGGEGGGEGESSPSGGKAAGAPGEKEEGGEASEGGGPSENTMYLMLESMWRVSLLDIEATLRHACNKVLSDQCVDKEARKARARGLVIMGRVFQSYGSSDALKTTDFSAHMQEVGQRMAQKVAEENDKENPPAKEYGE